MATIAGLKDFRREGPPADIGTFQFAATAMVFQFTFSGTTYTVAMASGVSGWVLISPPTVGADDVEISAAIAYVLALGGGMVLIKQGDYAISASIVGASGVDVFGEGDDTVLILDDDVDLPVITLTTVTFSKIMHLKIDGNRANNVAGSYGIGLVDSSDITVAFCNIVDCNHCAIDGAGACFRIRVLDNTTDNTWLVEILGTGEDHLIANNIGTTMIEAVKTQNDYTIICFNNFSGSAGLGQGVEIDGGAFSSDVIGNIIIGFGGSGVEVDGPSRCLVALNYILACGQNPPGGHTTHGIFTDGNDTRIIDNYLYLNRGHGIYVNSDRSIVALNKLEDNAQLFGNRGVMSGIYLDDADETIVTENHSRSPSNYQKYGIEEAGTSDFNSILNNNLRGNETGSLALVGPNTMAFHNQVDGTNSIADGVGIPTISGEFPLSNVGGGATAVAPVINTSPGGVDLDANDEFTHAKIPLPTDVQQIIRIKIWAYSNVIEATNNMLLRIVAHGAGSNEAWNGNAIDVVDHPSEETGGIVQYDVIHWVIDSGDDAQVATLAAQDLVELMAVGEAGSAPDVATDALFGGYNIEYL